MLGRIELRHVLGHIGFEHAIPFPDDEMRGVGRVHHVDCVDVARIFLADALEHPLGAGALDAHRNARILRLEGLRHLLGERQVDRRVPDDLAFLLRRLDQLGRDLARGRRRRCNAGKDARRGKTDRGLENVAPRPYRLAHIRLLSILNSSMSPPAWCRLSAQHTAAVRRQVEPDRGALRNVLGGRGHHAQLRAVGDLDQIVPAGAEKRLPDDRAGHHILGGIGLLARELYHVLAHRRGSGAAGHELVAAAAQPHARALNVAVVEHLALDHIARADEAGDELRARPVVNLLG